MGLVCYSSKKQEKMHQISLSPRDFLIDQKQEQHHNIEDNTKNIQFSPSKPFLSDKLEEKLFDQIDVQSEDQDEKSHSAPQLDYIKQNKRKKVQTPELVPSRTPTQQICSSKGILKSSSQINIMKPRESYRRLGSCKKRVRFLTKISIFRFH